MSVGKGLYLVKVPRFLAKEWEEKGPEMTLGELVEQQGAGSSSGASGPSRVLRLSEEVGYPPELPREYPVELSAQKPGVNIYAISQQAGAPEEPRLEGLVTHKGEITAPPLKAEYRKMMSERTADANGKRARTSTDITQDEMKLANPNYMPLKGKKDVKAPKAEPKDKQEKESDMSKEDRRKRIRSQLFEQFSGEGRKWWAKGDLAKQLGCKPTDRILADILEEVCERERWGPHKMEFRLKD